MNIKNIIDMDYFFAFAQSRFKQLIEEEQFLQGIGYLINREKYEITNQEVKVEMFLENNEEYLISIILLIDDMIKKEVSQYFCEIDSLQNIHDKIVRGCRFY